MSGSSRLGDGMDVQRATFLRVMDAIERGEVSTLVVAHKDRLARFGVEYLDHAARRNGCDIVVANHEWLSADSELVHELLVRGAWTGCGGDLAGGE